MLVIDRIKTGEKINKLIRKSGLRNCMVAKTLCVTRQTVSLWVGGKILPDIHNLVNLAKILNCTIDDILQTKGDTENE